MDRGRLQNVLYQMPSLDKAIVIEDFKPVVIGENCNGCGICENICSMINGKAFIKVFLKGINT